MLRLLLVWLACVPAAALLVAAKPRLAGVQVTRASDAQNVELASLWSEQDRAVLVFLRHFGCTPLEVQPTPVVLVLLSTMHVNERDLYTRMCSGRSVLLGARHADQA